MIPRQYLIGLVSLYTPLQRAVVIAAVAAPAAAAVHFSGDVVVDVGVVFKYGYSG